MHSMAITRRSKLLGNRFLVDLEMECDLEPAAESDQLEDAVNYQHAYHLIKQEMRRKKSNFLENIAKRILDALFTEMKGIQEATVRIRKMHPPMGGPIRSVGVSMSRSHE